MDRDLSFEEKVSGLQVKSKIAQKTAARLAAVQALYQLVHLGIAKEDVKERMRSYYFGYEHDGEIFIEPEVKLFEKIVDGVFDHMIEITALIDGVYDEDKDFQSCDLVHRLIVMAGVYELQYHLEIDAAIILNDYVQLAHSFYDGNERKAVNAVLDKLAKKLRA